MSDSTERSARRRRGATLLGATASAGLFFACTFTQSLDYLTKGDGDGGGAPDVVSDDSFGPEGGPAVNVLVPNQTKPGLLAQDEGALYWVAAGTVFSVSKTGGTPKMLGMAPAASSLEADADPNGAVFLTVGRDVLRLPKSGTGGGKVFVGAAGAPLAASVRVDDTSLFVLQFDDTIAESFLLRMAKDGGAPSNLAGEAGVPSIMALDTKNVVWLDTTTPITGAFYDLAKTATPGTPAKALPLAAEDDAPESSQKLAADDTTLFWATNGLNGMPGIFSRKRDTSATVIAVYRGDTETFGEIAVDATHVYAIENTGRAILRVPKAGGTKETLLKGLSTPKGLVVDDVSYYATVEATGSTGYILKMKK